MPTITCVGDSITEANPSNLPVYTDGWAYKLLKRLDPNGTVTASHFDVSGGYANHLNLYETGAWTVRNCGAAGHSASALSSDFAADVLPYAADYMILLAGFNDASDATSNAWIDANTKPAVTSMCDRAVAAGMTVVIGLITPRTDTQAKTDYANYIRAWLATFASGRGYATIDFNAPLELTANSGVANPAFFTDYGHPNPQGHTAMANAIALSAVGGSGGRGDYSLGLMPDASAGKDTFLYSAAATTNYGTAVNSYIGDGSTANSAAARILLAFDLSGIPAGSVITNAYISLFEEAAGATTLTSWAANLYRVLRAWTEAGATWNKYDGTNNWATAGGMGSDDCSASPSATLTLDAVSANGFITWSGPGLVSDIQAMVDGTAQNNGWLLAAPTAEYQGTTAVARNQFDLSDLTTVSRRPKFVVEYHAGGGLLPRAMRTLQLNPSMLGGM